ncbi:hypothetical protein RRG08_037077 [Elysia crispata]|uniref:Uncharacterized protein n=1 Tax=Elysia crispata TaxID=231223 RepID=A0AAE0ZX31_9GAST|nr:hypothetical protein RRG08_037077 [Elysia crispata]
MYSTRHTALQSMTRIRWSVLATYSKLTDRRSRQHSAALGSEWLPVQIPPVAWGLFLLNLPYPPFSLHPSMLCGVIRRLSSLRGDYFIHLKIPALSRTWFSHSPIPGSAQRCGCDFDE